MNNETTPVRDIIARNKGRRLTIDEMQILEWYREAKRKTVTNNFEGGNTSVEVLIVGNPGVVGVVNHQLDHIGGGLTSVMHGKDVADVNEVDFYEETKGWITPRSSVPVSAMCNRLGAGDIIDDDFHVIKHEGLAAV